MAKFQPEKVVAFRVDFESERAALDRIATSRKMSRSEILRGLVRRFLIEKLDVNAEFSK